MRIFNRDLRWTVLVPGLLWTVVSQPASALDTVTRRSTDKRAAGEITSVSKTEVTVKPKVGTAQTIPANDIASVEWDGEPTGLSLARSKQASGQYAAAIADFQQLQQQLPAGRSHLRADLAYALAAATGQVALGEDPEQRTAAITRLNDYLQQFPDHYRYYDALQMLGRVHVAAASFTEAEQAFGEVASAPWPEAQMAAKIALGRTALAQGEVPLARQLFDEVASTAPSEPAEQARRWEAMLGQATCLQQLQQLEEAADMLSKLILEIPPEEARLQAEAYVRQGDCLAAVGDRTKDAVLAYLHVDVIPALASQQDLHAEALFHLAELWTVLGQADRADGAAAKLQSLYPNSPWTAKVAGE